jgi:hypothetical protein
LSVSEEIFDSDDDGLVFRPLDFLGDCVLDFDLFFFARSSFDSLGWEAALTHQFPGPHQNNVIAINTTVKHSFVDILVIRSLGESSLTVFN